MSKKFFIVVIYLIFHSFLLFSQTPDPILNQPSPNATSLGIFGEFPQSDFTGVPAINVPIYTIKYRNVSIPISLNYNSNLLKTDQVPGWVGLGWNLTAGGAITRVVNDKPDDAQYTDGNVYNITSEAHVGYYYNHSALANTNWASTSELTLASDDWKNYHDYPYHISHGGSVKDYAPDEYSFSFMGYTGAFYLDPAGNWKVRSDQHFKVSVTTANMGTFSYFGGYNGFFQFTLTGNDGIQYVFGGDGQAVEFSMADFSYDYSLAVPKTWYLTQVILPNGDAIKLTYEHGAAIDCLSPFTIVNQPTFKGVTISGSHIQPAYLKTITTPFETVTFNRIPSSQLMYSASIFNTEAYWHTLYYNAWSNTSPLNPYYDYYFNLDAMVLVSRASSSYPQLDNIQIGSNLTYKFVYNNTTSERLKLSQLIRSTPTTPTQDSYNFYYYPISLTNTPSYLCLRTDYWGFYNGKAVDYTSQANFNTCRQPDLTSTLCEALNKIVYPTGGYSTYTFEQNQYTKAVNRQRNTPLTLFNLNQQCGGLRISKVTDFDNTGALLKSVNYYYDHDHYGQTSGHLSSGVLGGIPTYDLSLNSDGSIWGIIYSAIIPACYSNTDTHIGYSEVTEEYNDGSHIVKTFSNFDNGVNGEYMDESYINTLSSSTNDILGAFTSHAFERGKILSSVTYDANNNPLKGDTYTYTRINQAAEYVPALYTNVLSAYVTQGVWGETYLGRSYKLYTYAYLPTTTTHTDYVNGQPSILNTSTYTYDINTLNNTSIVGTNSKQQISEIDKLYPADMVSIGNNPNLVYSAMVNANVISTPIQSIKKTNGVQEVLTGNDYSNLSGSIFVPITKYVKYQANPVQQIKQYVSYDALGNILSELQPNGEYISYQWGYNNAYPVAKVENASNTSTITTSNSTGNITMMFPGNGIQPYKQIINVGTGGSTTLTLYGISSSSPSSNVYINITGPSYNNSFYLCPSPGSPSCTYPTTQILSNLSPGTYTISATVTPANSSSGTAYLNVTYPITNTTNNNLTEFYYTGFEDNPSGVIGIAHTGLKYSTNNTVSWAPPNSRIYVISYWYRLGGIWTYSGELPYTGSSYTLNSNGDAFDDIRIYPKDALMETYTYDPVTGMTSSADAKGETTYYEYDSFQRLMNIKDKDGNITKHMDYHYQGQ